MAKVLDIYECSRFDWIPDEKDEIEFIYENTREGDGMRKFASSEVAGYYFNDELTDFSWWG